MLPLPGQSVPPLADFWNTPEDDVAVDVANQETEEPTPEQIALLYSQRADTENACDELKNVWGFSGAIVSQRALLTELTARLVVVTYNLWSLFTPQWLP